MTKIENGAGETPRPVIKEQISTRAIEALMSNYRDAQQAFMDLIDNAVDNRIDDKPLTIRVRVSKNELSILNQGGEGLDLVGLDNYFTWGHSEKTVGKIGQFGVGGKAAMGYLGRSMEITCSGNGSEVEHRVSDPSWETREEGELKQFIPEERKAVSPDGYFNVRVTDLKREVSAQALTAKLGDIYRPLLLDGSVKIAVNNKEVQPLDIKYIEDSPELKSQTLKVETRQKDWYMLKIGALAEGQKIKPGIRCYYRGRLIEDEQFFGHPTPAQMPGASRLIGEAHLDFVPVTPNKATFNHSSVQWETSARSIHKALDPWITKLSKLRPNEVTKVEKYEKHLARNVKKVLEHVFGTTKLITKRDLDGESSGRLSPTRGTDVFVAPKRKHQSPRTREGKTAPLITATVGEKIKRWGVMHEIDVVSMGNPHSRAEVIDENGRKVLKINSDYPLYQVAKKLGEEDQEVYMAETAVMEICRIVSKDKSIDEYLELVNQILSETGEVFKTRIKDKRTRRTR